MSWYIFAGMSVLCWGTYGVLLHTGQMAMGDPENGRYKAFLFVGLAYLVAGVVGSFLILKFNNADWSFASRGVVWSTAAGIAGALGALGVILAFGPKALLLSSCPSSSRGHPSSTPCWRWSCILLRVGWPRSTGLSYSASPWLLQAVVW